MRKLTKLHSTGRNLTTKLTLIYKRSVLQGKESKNQVAFMPVAYNRLSKGEINVLSKVR